MKVSIHSGSGTFTARIENIESYPLTDKISITCADYEHGDRAITLLEHGKDLEFIDTHLNKNRARIHCKIVLAEATYRECIDYV